MNMIYDVMILGAGPAGLSAALYAGRSGLSVLLIEKGADGGQIAVTDEIENYPGSLEDESGPSLVGRMSEQAARFGAEKVYDTVQDMELDGKVKIIRCAHGDYQSKTVIIAAGAYPTPIGCPGERELTGKGVSYCATCDGNFFAGKEVVVVGGGDTAAADALYLSRIASRVHLVHRRDELRANHWYQERVLKDDNIVVHWNCVVTGVEETADSLSGVVLKDVLSSEISLLSCDGLFVAIGTQPTTEWLEGIIERDEQGYLVTDSECETSLPGVYAIGDVRQTPLRQVLTAAADGAIAAEAAVKFLAS